VAEAAPQVGASAASRLAEVLLLGEGFQLCVVTCPTKAAADELFTRLGEALDAAAGPAPGVIRLGPHGGVPDPDRARKPVTMATLTAVVLGPLELGPAERSGGAVSLFIDATGAGEEDGPAWRTLFRRLNEHRNAYARQLGVSLVLCLPPALWIALAREAPDLWSIRSLDVEGADEGPAEPAGQELGRTVSLGETDRTVLIEELARVFDTRSSAYGLLAKTGIRSERLVSFDAGTPTDYWWQVWKALDRGIVEDGVARLVHAAAEMYPGNRLLSRLSQSAGQPRPHPGDAQVQSLAIRIQAADVSGSLDLIREVRELAKRHGHELQVDLATKG